MTKVRDFLGQYRLARQIRLGSTCQVWEGIHQQTQEHFALKVLRPEKRGDKTELGFLKWEYSVGSSFHHKNIIKILDFVTAGDTSFLVIELFSEMNCKMALRRGPEQIGYMVEDIMKQTTQALAYIHGKGYIHCDVKPDNILVNRDSEVKVIDFTIAQKLRTGLGKLFGGKSGGQGTRSYMSPEQIRKQRIDERSDIYALGCTFYEFVSGKLPFTATSPDQLLSKHLSATIPSVRVQNPGVSNDFNEYLKTMMAKDPADRPGSMWEVAKMLENVRVFDKPPRLPESSIFDDYSGGRVNAAEKAGDDMYKR